MLLSQGGVLKYTLSFGSRPHGLAQQGLGGLKVRELKKCTLLLYFVRVTSVRTVEVFVVNHFSW